MKELKGNELAKKLGISRSREIEAVIKAQLITAVLKTVKNERLTHEKLAKRSGLPRIAVTGILSGSLQKVTIDRVLRLLDASNLIAEVKVKKATHPVF